MFWDKIVVTQSSDGKTVTRGGVGGPRESLTPLTILGNWIQPVE